MNRTLTLIRTLFESEDRWLDSYHRLGGALAKWDESLEPFRAQGEQAPDHIKEHGIGTHIRAFLNEAIKAHPEARWLTNYDTNGSRAYGHMIGFDPRMPEGSEALHFLDGRIVLNDRAHNRLRRVAQDYARDQGFPFHADGATVGAGRIIEILHHEAAHGLDHHRAHYAYRGLARALNEVNNVIVSRAIASHAHGPIMSPTSVPYKSTSVQLLKGLFPVLSRTYSPEDVRKSMVRAAWFWKDAQPRKSEEAGDVYASALADALPDRGRHGSMDRDDRAEALRKYFRSIEPNFEGWDGVKNVGAPKEQK